MLEINTKQKQKTKKKLEEARFAKNQNTLWANKTKKQAQVILQI